jgi:hypothetical protein
MRLLFLVPISTILIGIACHSSGYPDEYSLRVVVFDLDVKKTEFKSDAETIRDYIESKLINFNLFEVVGRKQIDKIVSEQKLELSGLTSEEEQLKIGHILNVKVGVVGEMGKVGSTYIITLKLLDLENSKFMLSSDIEASSIDDAFKQVNANLSAIADKAKSFLERPSKKAAIEYAYSNQQYQDARNQIREFQTKYGQDKRIEEINTLVNQKLGMLTPLFNHDKSETLLSNFNWTGWAFVAAGVISGGIGVYFDGKSGQDYQNMISTYNSYLNAGSTSAPDLWNQYQSFAMNTKDEQTARNVFYVVGGASTAVGIVFLLMPMVPMKENTSLLFSPGRVNYSVRF